MTTQEDEDMIGLDVGSKTTRMCVAGQGIILEEPSIVALDPDSNEEMVRCFLQKVTRLTEVPDPRVLVATPAGLTTAEQRTMEDGLKRGGASAVATISQPVAAAIGAGMAVQAPSGKMIVDIGSSTTQLAILCLAGLLETSSIRLGGESMDESIASMAMRCHNVEIGECAAEAAKIAIGSVHPFAPEAAFDVQGRDPESGFLREVSIRSEEVRQALSEPANAIVEACRTTLERCPPELAPDIIEHGIVLTGGGALLRGIERMVAAETGLRVTVAEEPMLAVIRGIQMVLEQPDRFGRTGSW